MKSLVSLGLLLALSGYTFGVGIVGQNGDVKSPPSDVGTSPQAQPSKMDPEFENRLIEELNRGIDRVSDDLSKELAGTIALTVKAEMQPVLAKIEKNDKAIAVLTGSIDSIQKQLAANAVADKEWKEGMESRFATLESAKQTTPVSSPLMAEPTTVTVKEEAVPQDGLYFDIDGGERIPVIVKNNTLCGIDGVPLKGGTVGTAYRVTKGVSALANLSWGEPVSQPVYPSPVKSYPVQQSYPAPQYYEEQPYYPQTCSGPGCGSSSGFIPMMMGSTCSGPGCGSW